MAKATYEAVVSAIEQIKADGRSPTIAAIQAITGGSNSTIVLLRQRYESERPTVEASKQININPSIGQLIAAEVERAAIEAAAEATAKHEAIKAEMLRTAEESEATASALEAAQQQLAAMQAQLQSMAGQIEQLKADSEQVKREAANQVAAAQASARDAITKAEDQAARERGERELAQVALAKAELRLEAMPKLQAEVEKLQTALDAERQAKAVSDAKAAALDAKATGLEGRLADCQAQADKAAKIADERLNEQNRSCSELVGTLKAEISGLQQRLVEALKPVEKPAA